MRWCGYAKQLERGASFKRGRGGRRKKIRQKEAWREEEEKEQERGEEKRDVIKK